MSTSAVEQPKCQWCGSMPHAGMCPNVKAIEFHEDGRVKRVEFMTGMDSPPIDYSNPKFTAAGGSVEVPAGTLGRTLGR